METPRQLDLDLVLKELGEFGRYQIMVYCFIVPPIMFSAIYNAQYIFNAGAIENRCLVPECESPPASFATGEWGAWALPEAGGRCDRLRPLAPTCAASSFHANQTIPCDRWVYEHTNTIVAEFDIPCQEWKRTLVGTVHSAGLFFALPVTGYISDTWGRRTALILTAVSAGLMGLIRSFSTGYIMYLVFEFLDASLGSGVYSTGFILALEMVGFNKRVIGGNIISGSFALGQVILAGMAYAIPYWRTLTRVIYAPSFIFILYYFILEESVRWLLSKGRKSEAARVIFKVAATNKRKLSPETIKLLTDDTNEPVIVTQSEEFKRHSLPKDLNEKLPPHEPTLLHQVLHSRIILSRLAICSFWWISVTFIYYGLSINSVSLGGDMYLNYIFTSLVEIPGYCLSVLTLDRFGRKSAIMIAFFICGISLIALPFIPHTLQWIQTCLNLIGKMAISMVFSSIYIYTSELFPTNARHSLLGFCSMIGRIGSIVAPQTPLLYSCVLASTRNGLTLIGKLCISMVFASIYIYTVELFPTKGRHIMLATCSVIGRIGVLFAPQTPLLMVYYESLPYLMFGAMAGMAGLLMLLTPETLHMRLPDTIKEAENMAQAPRDTTRAPGFTTSER